MFSHSATLYMLPSATLGEEKASAEREKLKKIKESMSDGELEEIIERTKTLEQWQKTEDTPEALDTLPKLLLSDISDKPEPYPTESYEVEGAHVVFVDANTRGITYTTLLFDISDFTSEELVLASLLTELYTMDCSPPSYSVHGISQASIVECVAISYSRTSS